jgi:MurNAc alpha-1-phosphate uridylyltransferase
MLLAAGLGTRMRPLTESTAKPLLPLAGKTLLDHALDRLAAAGVEEVVVNLHWQAEQVASQLARRSGGPRLVLSREAELRDTGGAVRACLDTLGPGPFFVVNGDSFWLDGPTPALRRLADAWESADADGLMLLHASYRLHNEVVPGDFSLDKWGRLRRRGEREIVPYVFAGVQLICPELLADMPEGAFSMNLAWDRAIARGRLRGLVHDGLWFHLSTPEDLAEAEAFLAWRDHGWSQ